jgi:polysaccharide chain length determinant protein (PEP-CTERM system associated)
VIAVNLFQSDPMQSGLNPRSILRALWKRKYLIAALWVGGSAATVAIVANLRPVYTAEALILVESQKIPENFVASTVQTALEARLDQLKEQVLSHERLWSLIEEFNLYPKLRVAHSREEVLEAMRKDVSIVLEKGWSANRPGAFRVAYETSVPTTASEVANRIGRFFIDENLRERAVEAEATSEFLDSQLAESKKNLQEQEAKLKDFKEAYIGELPQQEGALLAALSQDKAELMGIQDGLSRAQQNRLVLETSLAVAQDGLKRQQTLAQQRLADEEVQAGGGGEGLTPAAPPTELEQAQDQLRALRLRYQDKHPEVQRMLLTVARLQEQERGRQKEIAAAEAAPAPAPAHAAAVPRTEPPDDSTVRSLRAQLNLAVREIEMLEARRQRVISDASDIQSRVQKLPIREQQLASITRDYDTSKRNYQSLLDKKMAADTAADMEKWQKAERFVMLNPAVVPEKPVRPRRVLLGAVGSVFSLLLAGALAFLIELKKNVLLGDWELPAGTVVIGRLPRMQMEKA